MGVRHSPSINHNACFKATCLAVSPRQNIAGAGLEIMRRWPLTKFDSRERPADVKEFPSLKGDAYAHEGNALRPVARPAYF